MMSAHAAPLSASAAVATHPHMPGRFLAAVVDDVTRGTVRQCAEQLGWSSPEISPGGASALAQRLRDRIEADLLVLDLSDETDPIAVMETLAERCSPHTRVVTLGLANDVALYRRLLAMGVSDYLPKPVSGPVLTEALIAAMRDAPERDERVVAAHIIALIGARGGVGTTTIATSIAWHLAKAKRVTILDLDLRFGDVPLVLDLEPGRGLHDILASPDRIDSLLVGAATVSVNDHLRVLACEEPLDAIGEFGAKGLAELLSQLSESTDAVVVDLPRNLDELGRHVLGVADTVVVVSSPTLAGMRDSRRLIELSRAQGGQHRTLIVLNRVGETVGEVGRADFEHGVGVKVDVLVPFDPKAAAASAERGKCFAENVRNPGTQKALQALITTISGGAAAPAAPSLIDRILGR